MPVIVHTRVGVVREVFGTAVMIAADGSERPVKAGDVVRTGDVILTRQDSYVEIVQDAAPALAGAAASETDRVIGALAADDPIVAPVTGLDGGDGSGSGPGFRVVRINEALTPGTLQTLPTDGQITTTIDSDETEAPEDELGGGPGPSLDVDAPDNSSDSTPTISGNTTLAAGRTVTLTVTDAAGTTQTFFTTVDADGSFSADVPLPLAEGGYTVVASGTDDIGRVASDTDTGTIVIDLTPPVITVSAPELTDDSTPTLTGTTDAPPGTTVTLTITDAAGAVQTVTAVVGADGSYSVDAATPLADGTYGVVASVTTPGGSASASDNGVVDTTAPAPTIVLDPITGDDVVNVAEAGRTEITLSGRVGGDADPGDTVTVTVGGQDFITKVRDDGSFAVVVSGSVLAAAAADGVTASVTSTDAAGNSGSASAVRPYTLDAAPVAVDDRLRQPEDGPAGSGDLTPGTPDQDSDPEGGAIVVRGVAAGGGTPGSTGVGSAVFGDWGAVLVQADGRFMYTPGAIAQSLIAGETVTDTFSYTIVDPQGNTSTAQLTVTLVGANDAAVIGGDVTGRVVEDGVLVTSGVLTVADADAGEAGFRAQADVPGDYGSFSVDSQGRWSYTLDNDADPVQALAGGKEVTETFTVTSRDGTPRQVTVTVVGTDDPAVVSVGTGEVIEDVKLLASGTLTVGDIDSDLPTFVAGTQRGDYGGLALASNGQWRYTLGVTAQVLAEGQVVTDEFTVRLSDGSTTTVTITVTGTDDAPVVSAGIGAVIEDTLPSVSGQLTATDIDINDPTPTFVVGTKTGEWGSLVLGSDGRWTYTLGDRAQALARDQVETEVFTVALSDGSTTTTVTITVTGTDDLPKISSGSGAVVEDTSLTATGTLTATDVDNPALAFVAGTQVSSYGALALETNGQWTYTLDNDAGRVQALAAGQIVTDAFTVTLNDDSKTTVTITVTGTDDLPVISIGSGAVVEDTALTATGTLTATDVDNPALAFVAGTQVSSYGALALEANGQWTYTLDNGAERVQALAEGQVVTESFKVALNDGSSTTVTVTVTGTNDAPVANDDNYTLPEDGSLLLPVLANDTDVDSPGALSVQGFTQPTFGSVTLHRDGTFSYRADPDFYNTTPTFATVVDPSLGLPDNVFLVHDEQVAHAGDYMIAPPRSLTSNSITTLGRLPDGDFIVRISNGDDFERVVNVVGAGNAPDFVVTIPANSAAILNIGNVASGVSYTATGFPGTATVNNTLLTLSTPAETFSYTINDGQEWSSATVNITVTPTNDAPVARVDSRNLNEDVAGLSGNVIRPASANTGERNDTDKDGDALTVTGVAAGAQAAAPSAGVGTAIVGSLGTLVLSADGSYTYTPGAGAQALNGGQTAADVFTYTVSDGQGGSASTTLTMRVSGSNDAPVIDLDGDDSSGASGSGHHGSHVAAGPVAIADADLQVVDIDSPLLQRATVTLTNAQAGDVLTAGPLPSGISAALVGNVLTLSGAASTADYALALRAVGFDSSAASPPAGDRIITVSVFDGNLTSNLATSTITVIDQNDTPVNTLPGAITAVEDTRIAIPGLSVADPDAGSAVSAFKLATVALSVSNGSLRLVLAEGVTITGGANDSAALTLSGPQAAINTTLDSLSYIGNRDHNGGDVLTVVSRDALGLTDSDSVQVSVSGVNDAPTLAITQPSSPAFTEATGLGTQGAAVAVFSGVAVGTVEEAQTIQALTFTIDGIRDGLNEVLRLDGVTIALNSVNRSGTTPTNGMAFSVVYSGSTDNATATVTLTKSGGVSTAAMKSLLEGITYQNTHLDNPSVGDRPFTITRIQDNGGTAGGGVDVLLPNLVSTVRVVGVNDAPVAKTDEPPTNAVAGTGTAVTGNAVTGAGTGNIADTDPENALLRITGLAAGSTEAVLGNTAIVAPVTVKGVYGSLTFNADGSYSYLIDNADADTLALPGGGRATDVFSYTVTDSGGTGTGGALTDTGQITIQVAGPSTLTSSSTPINPLSYGVLGEFFGYNDNRTGRAGDPAYNPAAGSTTRWHADDGRASASLGGGVATGGVNLESTGDALFVINGRNVAAGGSAVTGTPTRSRDAATDARWIATDFDYGFNPQVNGSLGSNPKASSGSGASALPSGSLRDYIGTDINTLQITGGIGNTTDAVVRTFGYIYQPGGFADFRVTADDGFTLFLNGVEVAQYSANQGPTTREFIGKELQAGMNLLEMVYWEQGGNARLRVEAKNSGTDASQWTNLLSLDNSALFQPGLQPVLTAGQDIVETSTNRVWEIRTGATFAGSVNADTVTGSSSRDVITGNNGADNVRAGSGADNLSGGDGNDSLIGEAGADIVNGDAGDDSVDGGFGSDFLSGGAGNDIVVGGAGWDRLTGGSGTDTFDWNLADRGVAAGRAENPVAGTTANFNGVSSNGSRAQDFISDFDARPAASGGDVLDLRDLLIGETPATLDRFLDFNVIAGASPSTEIRISTAGGFSGGTYNSAVEDQRIVLEGVDIRASLGLAANAGDTLILQTLLDRAKLLVDA